MRTIFATLLLLAAFGPWLAAAQTERVSVASNGTQSRSGGVSPTISGNGRFVAFHGGGGDLVGDHLVTETRRARYGATGANAPFEVLIRTARIAWLEDQTGVTYATLRRHYGKWMPREGENELRKFEGLDPGLFSPRLAPKRRRAQVSDITKLEKCEEGDLNPHGCLAH